MKEPTHGWTRSGRAVHAKTIDHLPVGSAYQRFNKKVATAVTKGVGSMTCAYVFAAISLVSLPSVIKSHSVVVIVAWVAQTFLQLVLLSIIIVGTNLLGEASDARAEKTFADVEKILSMLDPTDYPPADTTTPPK